MRIFNSQIRKLSTLLCGAEQRIGALRRLGRWSSTSAFQVPRSTFQIGTILQSVVGAHGRAPTARTVKPRRTQGCVPSHTPGAPDRLSRAAPGKTAISKVSTGNSGSNLEGGTTRGGRSRKDNRSWWAGGTNSMGYIGGDKTGRSFANRPRP